MKELKQKTWRLGAVAVALLALAGCGGGGGTSSNGTSTSATGTISTTNGNSGASALALAAPAGVTLSIPADTELTDNSGNPVAGSIATSVSYSTTAADLPAAAGALPSGTSLVAFADVTLTGSTASVKNLSRPATMTFKVPAGSAATGDALVLYSFDAGAGQWSFAGTEIVDAEGNVSTGVGHLSVWGLFKSAAPPPVKPAGLTGVAGDSQATLIWSEVPSATSYNIYWAATAGVGTASGTKISGAVSGQAVTGLTNGTSYYFVVTALNAAGESVVSSEVSLTPSLPVPGRPSGVAVSGGDAKVTITWNEVSGATSYNIYYGTSAGVTKSSGTKVAGVTAPQEITGLTNGQAYFFVVTAENASGEGVVSSEKSVTPAAAPQAPGSPTGATATAGVGQVTVSWKATVPGATSYNVYYLQSASAPSTATVIANGTKINSATSPVVVNGLTAGSNYWFIVTAVNIGGESAGQSNPKPAVPQ